MRYLEMLKSAEFRDDLDVVSTIHTPKGQRPFCNELARFVKIILHQLEVYDPNSSGITSLPYFELNHALGMALSSYQVAALTVTAHETGVQLKSEIHEIHEIHPLSRNPLSSEIHCLKSEIHEIHSRTTKSTSL